MQQLVIRAETDADIAGIYQLTEAAFTGRPYAGGDEQDVINRLRDSGDLTLSLVALRGDELVGQVTFSPAVQADGTAPWFALGPVSVRPDCQNQGIGAELIEAGLGSIQQLGALGCILTGNPAYYRRFGFNLCPGCVPLRESADYFMLKLFDAQEPRGAFTFHPAFYES